MAHIRLGRRMSQRELPSVSFHYLKYLDDPQDTDTARGFTEGEFEALLTSIADQAPLDLGEALILERVRSGNLIPFSDFHLDGKRCAFGRFKAPYSGHSFENSDKGKIEASSVNQRLFNFMLYHTNDGRIFAGAQYLGNYGGWGHLSNGLKGFFDQKNKIQSTSIRKQGNLFEHVYPKEIKITVSKKSESIDKKNILTQEQVITLRRGKDGQEFEKETRRSILSILTKPLDKRGDELRKVLQDSGLQEFDDYDIEDCVVVADIKNGTKRYHIFENGLQATRFALAVPLDNDGHPIIEPTRNAMKQVFIEQILPDLGSGDN